MTEYMNSGGQERKLTREEKEQQFLEILENAPSEQLEVYAQRAAKRLEKQMADLNKINNETIPRARNDLAVAERSSRRLQTVIDNDTIRLSKLTEAKEQRKREEDEQRQAEEDSRRIAELDGFYQGTGQMESVQSAPSIDYEEDSSEVTQSLRPIREEDARTATVSQLRPNQNMRTAASAGSSAVDAPAPPRPRSVMEEQAENVLNLEGRTGARRYGDVLLHPIESFKGTSRGRKVASVGGILAVGAVVVTGGGLKIAEVAESRSDDPASIAEGIEFGAGFDENGQSETSLVAANISLSPDIAMHLNGEGLTKIAVTEDGKADPDTERSWAKLNIDGAQVRADIYDPDEQPSSVVITESESGETDRVATLRPDHLEVGMSILGQEDGFFDLNLTNEEFKMDQAVKDFLYDGAEADINDAFKKESVDEFVENVENPALQETLAYEALSDVAEELATSEQGATIRDNMTELARQNLEEYLQERDPDHSYDVVVKEGAVPKLKLKSVVPENTEDGGEYGIDESNMGDYLHYKKDETYIVSAEELKEAQQ